MRKLIVTLLAAGSLGATAAPALAATAGPDIPKIPSNCHEWNDLLGIDNVRSCDGDTG